MAQTGMQLNISSNLPYQGKVLSNGPEFKNNKGPKQLLFQINF